MTFSMRIMARELAACIQAANTVTDTGVKLPILRATHISIDTGTATFIATNTDQTVSCRAACQGSGVVVLDTAMLLTKSAVCKPDQPIDFDGDGKTVEAKQGRVKWKMPCLSPDEFPLSVAEQIASDPVPVIGRDICAALNRTREALQPKSPNILGGIYFDFTDGKLRLVGAARAGMHIVEIPGFAPVERAGFVLPETSIGQVASLFQGAASCELRSSALAFSLTSENLMYRSKLIEGNFPPYRQVIPQNSPGQVVADAAELSSAIKQALAIRDDGKSLRLKMNIDEDEISIRVTNADGEESESACPIEREDGKPVSFSLSPSRLMKALATLDCDTVRIGYSDHMSAFSISPVAGEAENLRVIMPMRM